MYNVITVKEELEKREVNKMFEEMMMMVRALEAVGDVMFNDWTDGSYDITFCDFEGFDEDWEEVMRDYADEMGVEALQEWLEEHCVSQEDDFYVVYHFEGFDVQVGFTSFDI